jgi:hypothetical protein
MKTFFLSCLLACLALTACTTPKTTTQAKTNLRFEKTWPDAGDLAWFQQAKGKSEKEVLAVYGPPLEKQRLENGRTRWRYPWAAAAYLDFEKGTAVNVFYTSGY